jgi:hypothetical protein
MAKGRKTTTAVTMREFRAAPAKILRRAARTHTRLRIGDLTLVVEESKQQDDEARVHGCMRGTGRILGRPDELLSARDRWSTDG